MRRVVRQARLREPRERVWEACIELLRTPDPRRGVVSRRCHPDPPAADSVVTTTVRDRRGERTLRAIVVGIDRGVEVATASDGPGALVSTVITLRDREGGTEVTLTSEAESGFPVGGRAGRVLDSLLLGGPQRRSARATLRRLREVVSGPAGR